MRFSAPALAALGLCLVALSACQDPSGVGLGLIDEDLSNPNVRLLEATVVDTVETAFSTSGFADAASGSSLLQQRVLVGRATDALYGDVASMGYIDAVAPTSFPDDFGDAGEGNRIVSVSLRLRRDYVYGDTTASLPIELRRVTSTWAPAGLPADTTLNTGDLLTTTTMTASDTLAVLTLPNSFLETNRTDTLFTSSTFPSAFEGFELRVPSPSGAGAVVGFNVTSALSVLRVISQKDTVDFKLSEVFSRVERGTPGLAPLGRRLLRGAAPEGLRLSFDYSSLLNTPLAQAVFRLPIDRTYSGTSGTFVRPLASQVAVYVRPLTGDPIGISVLNIGDTGDGRSASGTTFGPALTSRVQSILLGQESYRHFELQFQRTPISLDVLPVALDAEPGPRLSLTIVGQPT